MKKLADTVHECGYLFGIHDQYRDFYLDAESFDPEEAVRLPDGSMPQHSRWAGGPQSYLCASRAPYYVKRNFHERQTAFTWTEPTWTCSPATKETSAPIRPTA